MGLAQTDSTTSTPQPSETVQPLQNPTTPNVKTALETALAITSRFEGKGYGEVSGDFDGQGLSCGILQWCFGQGSLQEKILRPYLKAFGSIDALGIFPSKVDAYAAMSAKQALSACRTTMLSGKDVKASWLVAWEKFLVRPEVIQLQLQACQIDRDLAQGICDKLGLKSLRAFCWAFDVVTQEGSLEGVGLQSPDRAALFTELTTMKIGSVGASDFKKNIDIWMKTKLSDEQVSILRTTLKRAALGSLKYICDVVNRKGSIAVGSGYVHGTMFAFPELESVAATPSQPSTDIQILRDLADSAGLNRAPIDKLISTRDSKYPKSKPRYWAVVDFTRHSSQKRLFVLDVIAREVKTYLVAHGKGSEGKTDDGFADVFSNVPGSECSSLGVYRCAESYQGKHGLSMRLDGLEPTNSNARDRAVVLHGADYVSQDFIEKTGRIGRSDGCTAVENRFAPTLVSALREGSLLVIWKA